MLMIKLNHKEGLHDTALHLPSRGRPRTPLGLAHRSSSRLSLVTRPSSRLRPLNIPKEEEEEEEGTEDIPEDDDDDDESRDYSTLATRESFSGLCVAMFLHIQIKLFIYSDYFPLVSFSY